MSDQEEKPQRRRIIDEIGTVELMTELFKFFGTYRALQLVGWATLWGIQGVQNSPEFREKLKERGVSRSVVYRASMDLRRFKDWVEFRVGHPVTMEELLEDLKEVGKEGASPVPESG